MSLVNALQAFITRKFILYTHLQHVQSCSHCYAYTNDTVNTYFTMENQIKIDSVEPWLYEMQLLCFTHLFSYSFFFAHKNMNQFKDNSIWKYHHAS